MGGIDYHFAHASLIGHVAVKADGIILSPFHSYQILSFAHFFHCFLLLTIAFYCLLLLFIAFYCFSLSITDDDHKILGDGGDGIADAASDF